MVLAHWDTVFSSSIQSGLIAFSSNRNCSQSNLQQFGYWLFIISSQNPALNYLSYPLTLGFCVAKKKSSPSHDTVKNATCLFSFWFWIISCFIHALLEALEWQPHFWTFTIQLWWHTANWPAEVTAHQNHQPEKKEGKKGAALMVCMLSCYASTTSLPLAWGRNELKAETCWTSRWGWRLN